MENIEQTTSRNIPEPIKREVRQRCGFGCVICGFPIYEYEHMEEWAIVKRHVADEITLLCDQHHKEKTAKLLPKEKVFEANNNPYNLQNGVSKPYNMHYYGNNAEVEYGNNKFSLQYNNSDRQIQMVPLMIDNIPLIYITLLEGHYLLNLILFDKYNKPILQIKDNQLFYMVDTWDIKMVGSTLTINQASRDILIQISFQPPSKIIIVKGKFLLNGVEVLISSENILITNNSVIIRGCNAVNRPGGIFIGKTDFSIPAMVRVGEVNRYLKSK